MKRIQKQLEKKKVKNHSDSNRSTTAGPFSTTDHSKRSSNHTVSISTLATDLTAQVSWLYTRNVALNASLLTITSIEIFVKKKKIKTNGQSV